MKRNALSFFLLFIVWLPGLPQEDDVIGILKESNANLERISDFSADFTYTIENKSKPLLVSKNGKLQYARGKYALIMEDQEIFCDGKSIWIHIPGDREVTIMNYDPEEGLGLKLVFSPFYEEATTILNEGKQKVGGITYDQIYLVFTNPEVEYHQARLWINETSKLQEKIVFFDRRQTITTYEFSNINTDQGLPESTFVFDTNNFSGGILDER